MALALSTAPKDASTWSSSHEPISTVSVDLLGMKLLCCALRMPFDMLRTQHAQSVRAGLTTRSILESREFENRVHALEHFWLGPFARRA